MCCGRVYVRVACPVCSKQHSQTAASSRSPTHFKKRVSRWSIHTYGFVFLGVTSMMDQAQDSSSENPSGWHGVPIDTSLSVSPSAVSEGQMMLHQPGTFSPIPQGDAPRRRSTRDIRRPKFDDELVESSVPNKSPRKHLRNSTEKMSSSVSVSHSGGPSPSASSTTSTSSVQEKVIKKEPATPVTTAPPVPTAAPPVSSVVVTPVPRGKGAKGMKKGRPPKNGTPPTKGRSYGGGGGKNLTDKSLSQSHSAALEDVGRWTATDDLALVTAVLQTSDLRKVHSGVKFCCKFTLEEIQQRWYALLYDPHLSKLATEAMKQLPAEVIISVQSNTLFTKTEEKALSTINAGSNPVMQTFEELLQKNPDMFHHARTPRSLFSYWQHMKQNRLLPDQKQVPWPTNETKDMTFSEVEDNLESEPEVMPVDPLAESELVMAERRLNRQIRVLENEIPKWQVLVESVTGISPPDFDPQTMAVLRGRLVRFLVRSREVSLGRNTKDSQVDIDLSLEGPAFQISRRQATIKLRATGEFFVINDGKRAIYIDGKPLLSGSKMKLDNNAVIEIANLRLVFLVNQDLMNTLRMEATKMMIS